MLVKQFGQQSPHQREDIAGMAGIYQTVPRKIGDIALPAKEEPNVTCGGKSPVILAFFQVLEVEMQPLIS